MFQSMAWRKQNNIDSLLDSSYQEPEAMKYWPGGVVGLDKEGRPLQIDRFGKCDIKGSASSVSLVIL